ncbi:MAG: hypothetical protein ACEY26_00520 [Candidatus Hodgkinia cicadicola]
MIIEAEVFSKLNDKRSERGRNELRWICDGANAMKPKGGKFRNVRKLETEGNVCSRFEN